MNLKYEEIKKKILIEDSVNGMKTEVIVMSFRSLRAFSAF